MRKVTEQIVKAFIKGQSKTIGNTSTDGKTIRLHGHEIIRKVVMASGFFDTDREIKDMRSGWFNSSIVFDMEHIQINNCGYETNTTKERLNGFLEVIGLKESRGIYQRNFEWFWKNGESFPNNQWVTIN